MPQLFIRLPEVQRRTGYSKAWIYRLRASTLFYDVYYIVSS